MTSTLRPMLACRECPAADYPYKWPVLVSPKLDGVRALVKDGVVLSRTLKPIPNAFVQRMFGHEQYEGFDGELIVGPATSPTAYRDTMSGVMSQDGEPDVTFHVFDLWDRPQPYVERYQILEAILASLAAEQFNCVLLKQFPVASYDALGEAERLALAAGFEGLMVRSPDGLYKYGRTTYKTGVLLKLKRFEDAEAVVVGFEERQHNGNAAAVDERGYTKRSTHQANKTGRGDLGALVVHLLGALDPGQTFNIGTGFDDAARAAIWANRHDYVGRVVKFKHFPTGGKDLPRHPVFLGWRDRADMDAAE